MMRALLLLSLLAGCQHAKSLDDDPTCSPRFFQTLERDMKDQLRLGEITQDEYDSNMQDLSDEKALCANYQDED